MSPQHDTGTRRPANAGRSFRLAEDRDSHAGIAPDIERFHLAKFEDCPPESSVVEQADFPAPAIDYLDVACRKMNRYIQWHKHYSVRQP